MQSIVRFFIVWLHRKTGPAAEEGSGIRDSKHYLDQKAYVR